MMQRLLVSLVLLVLAACASEQAGMTAENVHIPQPVPGVSMGAAYLTLTNNSDQEISITRVSSPNLTSVEMHESTLQAGVSRMAKLQKVAIAPRQSVVFEPGAKHLMLRYPAQMPNQITLQFFADDALLLSIDTILED